MERSDVYKLIDGEREYQDNLASIPNRTDGSDHTVGDYITMMGHYYHTMVTAWTLSAGDMPALDVMRKVAAIAVHCMEDHDTTPARKTE